MSTHSHVVQWASIQFNVYALRLESLALSNSGKTEISYPRRQLGLAGSRGAYFLSANLAKHFTSSKLARFERI